MKTSTTQPLQFSGYPLKPAEVKPEEKLMKGKTVGDWKPGSLPEKSRKVLDSPENWDETWFANYE